MAKAAINRSRQRAVEGIVQPDCPLLFRSYIQARVSLEVEHAMSTSTLSDFRESAVGVWRPWLITPKDIEREQQRQMATSNHSDSQQTPTGDKVPAFRHPVRLFWPKSKCFDYLYEDATYLLTNFPVQATISFYQESDSESESEDSD
uniref:protein ripply2-like n=1 Tax=Pristiophorus japonicus TaxID=55135 RepID=UPI00398ED08E